MIGHHHRLPKLTRLIGSMHIEPRLTNTLLRLFAESDRRIGGGDDAAIFDE
jgi:hypothetical protein